MTTIISRTVFNRFVATMFFCLQLAAGAILLAGSHDAYACGGGSARSPIDNGDTGLKPN